MTSERDGAPEVTEEADRFTISVAGRVVGVADFHDRGTRRIFPHTQVMPAFRGRGLATTLVREALESTRRAGLTVEPQCWMVAEFIEKNPEFGDLLDRASG